MERHTIVVCGSCVVVLSVVFALVPTLLNCALKFSGVRRASVLANGSFEHTQIKVAASIVQRYSPLGGQGKDIANRRYHGV